MCKTIKSIYSLKCYDWETWLVSILEDKLNKSSVIWRKNRSCKNGPWDIISETLIYLPFFFFYSCGWNSISWAVLTKSRLWIASAMETAMKHRGEPKRDLTASCSELSWTWSACRWPVLGWWVALGSPGCRTWVKLKHVDIWEFGHHRCAGQDHKLCISLHSHSTLKVINAV